MHPLRTLTLVSLAAALAACPAKDDDVTDDTDTDVEDTDTDVEDTDDTDEDTDTDTDTDVTFVPEPCEAEGVAETRIVLDPTAADTEYFSGGALQNGLIPVPDPVTTWFVADNTGGTASLEADVTHRVVVEFDPAITLSRAASYTGVQLIVRPTGLRGGVSETPLDLTIVREGTMTHDLVEGATYSDGRIDLFWEEDPGREGGSAALGDTLSCVAFEFEAEATGSFGFGPVEFRMPESGDTRSSANPFQPLPPEM